MEFNEEIERDDTTSNKIIWNIHTEGIKDVGYIPTHWN